MVENLLQSRLLWRCWLSGDFFHAKKNSFVCFAVYETFAFYMGKKKEIIKSKVSCNNIWCSSDFGDESYILGYF